MNACYWWVRYRCAHPTQLEELAKWTEHWNRVAEDIARRQQICRKGTGQPQAPSQPQGTPSQPGPKKPPATSKPPVVASEPPANPDVPNNRPPEQPPGEGTEISPPAPTTPPRQVGLPYTPGDCGCGTKRPLGADQTGIASLQTGLANLATCVDSFSNGPLSDYLRTLQEWTTVAVSLNAAAQAGPETVQAAAKEALPRVESLLARTRSFDQAGKAFLEQMQTCPEATSAGADVLQSAKNTGTPFGHRKIIGKEGRQEGEKPVWKHPSDASLPDTEHEGTVDGLPEVHGCTPGMQVWTKR